MEPFTIIGGAAAINELLGLSIKTSQTAWTVVRSFREAPVELQQLAQQLDLLRFRIKSIQNFGDELSDIDMDDLFPEAHRLLLEKNLTDQLKALEDLKSLQCGHGSSSIRVRARWAAIDQRKAKSLRNKIDEFGVQLNDLLTILNV